MYVFAETITTLFIEDLEFREAFRSIDGIERESTVALELSKVIIRVRSREHRERKHEVVLCRIQDPCLFGLTDQHLEKIADSPGILSVRNLHMYANSWLGAI